MAFQPAPNIVKVEIRFVQFGQLTENVLHVRTPGPPTAADLEAIANSVGPSVIIHWMPRLHTSISFTEVKCTDMSVEGGDQFVLSASPPAVGLVGGFRLPNETSLAVRLKAQLGGRSGSGRIFWQGLADGQVTGTNFASAATVAEIIEAIEALIEALQTIGYIVVILSRYLNNVARPTAVSFGPVAVSVFDTTLDSQRRRKPGFGT